MNVEAVLAADDGKDAAAIVPEVVALKTDFGEADQGLEMIGKITKYSWDQSKLNVSIYIPFDALSTIPESDITCVFKPFGVLVVVRKAGKKLWYKMPNLCNEIDTAASSRKVKSDQLVVKLRKLEQGQVWSDLSDDKDRYQKQREYRLEHGDLKGATTEQLLADMYKDANDEDRAGLRDAMRINRQKREEEAKSATART